MSRSLVLSKSLHLPVQAVTETFGILAARGAGKSNTAAVMAEEMFAASLPFVVIDPARAWWGLRASADGTGPGLSIPIFGGKHGDVPLERTAGLLIADLVVDERLSCVLDLDGFESESARKQFLLDFARRLYTRNEQPLHLFLEEADDYIPQRPQRDEAQLLRAWENIVRRGRNRGIGCTLITQRSAAINKSVLTQVQTLIAMRTTGPQDIAAIREWVKYHQQSEEIISSLASLANGEAWVWSPQFLKKTVRTQFRLRETFDSGATPKVGRSEIKAPSTLADIDLASVKKRMAATIEKAKQEDPRELKRQVAELRAELARKTPPPPKRVDVPILKDAQIKRLEQLCLKIMAEATKHDQAMATFWENQQNQAKALLDALRPVKADPRPVFQRDGRVESPKLKVVRNGPPSDLPKGERLCLQAIAMHADGVTRPQLTVLTGYKRSTRDAYIQRLKERGLVETAGDGVVANSAGIEALGSDFEPLPTGADLQRYWLSRLPEGESKILDLLLQVYPKGLDRDVLSEKTGYQRSTRDAYIQRLKARQLVLVHQRGVVQAATHLF